MPFFSNPYCRDVLDRGVKILKRKWEGGQWAAIAASGLELQQTLRRFVPKTSAT